jgi:hypothetical protein
MSHEAAHERADWTEIVSAVVLALATIASAWSAYQATRWSGVMAIEFSEASAARTVGTQAFTRGGQLTQIDVATFVAWSEAVASDDQELATFLFARFRPEFRVAAEAWLDTRPLDDPDAPPTPFEMDAYRVEEVQRGEELYAEADRKAEAARVANQIGDNYVLTTVLFASVLFFAGIASKFKQRRVKRALLALGLLAFAAGTVLLTIFPVH